ncbi:MAG: hypothetical protein CPSOU_6558 [uncultured Paraburkholderia sp.]|nr:MAG: hypothetical protein CPSOU_6558 [uncultured Paraburkholderia sp.]
MVSLIDESSSDSGKLQELYVEASPQIRQIYPSEPQFADFISKMRGQHRVTADRVSEAINGGFLKLPGLVSEKYAIVIYNTHFEGDPFIYTEEVTIGKEGLRWVFVGYYLSVKPYLNY